MVTGNAQFKIGQKNQFNKKMKDRIICSFLIFFALCGANIITNDNKFASDFRPPAVPLINFDPYMNIWSMADNLYDDYTK